MLINLTPHDVIIRRGSTRVVLRKSGNVARCIPKRTTVRWLRIDGVPVPVTRIMSEEVVGLPEPSEGIYYVVSHPVARKRPYRTDLLVPDVLERIDGKIEACWSLGEVYDAETE